MSDKFIPFYDSPTGPIELSAWIQPMRNGEFEKRFPGQKALKWDSFSMRVASLPNSHINAEVFPVTRAIRYKARPSLHACNAKCMGGKPNGTCECLCGGKNHGISH